MAILTVKELREFLDDEEFKDDYLVILSKDAEGNSFSPVQNSDVGFLSVGKYVPHCTYEGEVHAGEDLHGEPNCIVLWPTN